MDLNMALIKADILMAKQGIRLFEQNGIREIKNMTAYHLQQAAEKLIKIQIYRSGVEYNNKQLYIHNLVSLIRYAKSLGIEILIPKEIDENALDITDWEAGSRYDLHFSIRIDKLKKIYSVIWKWYEAVYAKGIR
ncbi:MAG: HEPN domain-containing protein [Phascolarctobacterium sp.]|nr:HEPN domain-containing protein [Phascolarctobacterium sp.]